MCLKRTNTSLVNSETNSQIVNADNLFVLLNPKECTMKLNNCQYTSKKRHGLCSIVLFLVLAMTIVSWTPVYASATITEVSTFEHDSSKSLDNSFVQVDADTFALAFAGIDDDGFITTFDISADGTTITEVSTIEHDTIRGEYNSFVQVDSNTFALAYSGNGDDGFIATFDISADGTTITEVSSLEHDGLGGKYNSFVQVDADTFALAYTGFKMMALSLHLTYLQTGLQ